MKYMIIILSFVISYSIYSSLRVYKYERKWASMSLQNNRYALATIALKSTADIKKYKELHAFITDTFESIDLKEEDFLKLFDKPTKINLNKHKDWDVETATIKSELIELIKRKTFSRNMEDFIVNFIALQENLLILKFPLRYFYVKIKLSIQNIPVSIAFFVFKLYCKMGVRFNFIRTNKIKKEFGNHIFICRVEKKATAASIVSKTDKEREKEIRQVNNMGTLGLYGMNM